MSTLMSMQVLTICLLPAKRLTLGLQGLGQKGW